MPMIPEDEIERIKRETDLAAVIRVARRGVKTAGPRPGWPLPVPRGPRPEPAGDARQRPLAVHDRAVPRAT